MCAGGKGKRWWGSGKRGRDEDGPSNSGSMLDFTCVATACVAPQTMMGMGVAMAGMVVGGLLVG